MKASSAAAAVSRLTKTAIAVAACRLSERNILAYWWPHANFGDAMAADVFRLAVGVRPFRMHQRFRGKILGLGSIVEHSQRGDIIWGSGLIQGVTRRMDDRTFLAVRGPRTRQHIKGEVPEVYGDPAILLPRFYRPTIRVHYPVGLVPHWKESEVLRSDDPSILNIDVRTYDWRRVVNQICSCDVIVSSSLHGIIVAEAYGIPAIWVQMTDHIIGRHFKFLDYYEATNRDPQQPSNWNWSIDHIDKQASPLPTLDGTPLLQAWETYRPQSTGEIR